MNLDAYIAIAKDQIPNIVVGITIFLVFWFISKLAQYMINKLLASKNPNTNISRVISGIIKNLIVIMGLITALGTVGVNVSAIVAGLGLTGFAFGFAFKDMLSNFISGIMIFVYEPFNLGDTIEVDGKTGKVVDINLRYVTLESEEANYLIPNSKSVSGSLKVIK